MAAPGQPLPRLRLAHLPTPLIQPAKLARELGIDLWIKRDDCTAGAAAGNKIRKLEYLLADAVAQGCDHVITCGGVQSNHARATAILARQLGMEALLFLRGKHAPSVGNVLLDTMVGAEIRLISAASYGRRDAIMAAAAEELRAAGRTPYVVPEGGSNGLGAMGYVQAMAEIRQQLDDGVAGGQPFDLVVHACGSGGTAAGVALGAAHSNVASNACAMAVCDDVATFKERIGTIIDECRQLDDSLGPACAWYVDDSAKGPAYAVPAAEQLADIAAVARLSGLILDPVYSGKAMSGLWQHCRRGRMQGQRVLFIHTGGLPGLLAQHQRFADHWSSSTSESAS